MPEHKEEPCLSCGGTDSIWLGYPNSLWLRDRNGNWWCPVCRKINPFGYGGCAPKVS